MRIRQSLILTLALPLAAGPAPELPLPGLDRSFLANLLGDTEGGTKPWRTFQGPPDSASAVVEVVGELSAEELRQATFLEFLAWFHQDLQRFLRRHGGNPPRSLDPAAATQPVDRFGGNPLPRPVPLVRVGF